MESEASRRGGWRAAGQQPRFTLRSQALGLRQVPGPLDRARPAPALTRQRLARPASPTRSRTAAPPAVPTLPPPPATHQPHLGRAPRSHRPPAAPPPPPPPAPGPSPPLPLPPLPAPPAPGSASRPRPLSARASGQARSRAVVTGPSLFAAEPWIPGRAADEEWTGWRLRCSPALEPARSPVSAAGGLPPVFSSVPPAGQSRTRPCAPGP